MQTKMQQIKNNLTIPDIIELAIFPPSLLRGWFIVPFLLICSYFILVESCGFFFDYMNIYEWKDTQGYITDIKLDESKTMVCLTYKYKVNDKEYVGNKIGIQQSTWYNIGPREIYNLQRNMNNSWPIIIRYNPKNNIDSVYACNSNQIIVPIFMAFLSMLILSMILLTVARKLIKFINSR